MFHFTIKEKTIKLNEPKDLYKALLDKRRYRYVFDLLRSKEKKQNYRKYSYANHPELTLYWILSNERLVTKWILKHIKQKSYCVSVARETEALLGNLIRKKRILYRLEWPDRILQMVLAETLSELLEKKFSNSLFSYRKGRSALQAIDFLRNYIKTKQSNPLFILKRDVKSYGDIIQHKPLLELIYKLLPDTDSFVLKLLHQFIKFDTISKNNKLYKKKCGLPTGMPINCILENIFLMPMDNVINKMPEVFYMRYGDDILAISTSYNKIIEVRKKMDIILNKLGLYWNNKKCDNYIMVKNKHEYIKRYNKIDQIEFTIVDKITQLGVSVNYIGNVNIAPDKISIIRKQLKYILNRANYQARSINFNNEERLKYLIFFANTFFADNEVLFRKIEMTYFLSVVTTDRFVIEFDKWVAMCILSVFYGRFSKTNFRKTPYKKLRNLSLKSLYIRRRKIKMKMRKRKNVVNSKQNYSL